MLSAERRSYILEVLKRDGRLVVPALSEELGVSIDTIRRDLRDLASEGRLQRVHGGALPATPVVPNFATRQRSLTPQKVSIGAQAARLIQNGMVVAIGGGSTNLQAAEHIPHDIHATVITHNPPVAVALADHPNIEVILAGGRLYKYTMVTVGPETIQTFQQVRADLCLLGVLSLHPEIGISNVHYEESQVQRAMIACSAEVVALISSERLGTAAPYVIGPLADLNQIITDIEVVPEVLAPYRAAGIEITQV